MTEFKQEIAKSLLKKPEWLKTKLPSGDKYFQIKESLKTKKLVTVCQEAKCPNITECWNEHTATFMIAGDTCTRACRFCNVKTGNPKGWIDPHEPDKIAQSCQEMSIDYAVITMVDRDDLADFGAEHVYQTLHRVQDKVPALKIEFLSGDFNGSLDSLKRILESSLVVLAHNIETTEKLTKRVRDARASYKQSLEVLERAKILQPKLITKSAIMLGLGESIEDVQASLLDLRGVGVDIVTLGQYMRPSKKHLSIKEYIHPNQFKFFEEYAYQIGFKAVASGPLVRSSYKAKKFYELCL